MSAIKRVSRFTLWRIKREGSEKNPLFLALVEMLNQALAYSSKTQVTSLRLSRTLSFRDALKALADDAGLTVFEQGSELLKDGVLVPAIARDKKKDAPVLLLPYSQRTFLVINAMHGQKYLCARGRLTEQFDEVMLLFPKSSEAMKSHTHIATSLRSLLPRYDLTILSAIALLCACGGMIISASLLSDYGVINQVPLMGLGLGLVLLLHAALHQSAYIARKNRAMASFLITHDFLRRVFSLSYEQFAKLSQQTFATFTRAILHHSKTFFVERARLIGSCMFFVILAAFSWVSFSLFALFVLLYGMLFFILSLCMRAHGRLQVQEHDALSELAQDFERYNISMLALKGLHVSTMLLHTIKKKHDHVQAISSRVALYTFLFDASYFFFPLLSALLFAVWCQLQPEVMASWLSMVWLLLSLVMGVLAAGFINHLNAAFAIVSHKKTAAVVDSWKTMREKTHVEPVNIEGTIELINVSFHYEQSPLIIKNQTLTFEKQQFHVVQGASGAGKSTLLKIIMGMLTPTEGHVVIDGQDIRSLNQVSLRRHFGVVFTDSSLFAGSVFENIMCGRSIPLSQLERLLLSHEVFDYLIDLPMGLETYIFWHTKNVSRFEQKLILLARALVHEPSVLFMDEILHDVAREHRIMLETYLAHLPITRILTSLGPLIAPVSHRTLVLDATRANASDNVASVRFEPTL